MNPVLYYGIAAFIVILWGITAYNRLVHARIHKDEAWSGILVQLKRRHDLVPNLAASASGLAEHEKDLMNSVTQARAAQGSGSVREISQAEGKLSQTLGRFIAVAENYPQIKADTACNKLMEELSSLEEDLQMARRYYNGTVRDYNVMTQSFPSALIAKLTGFSKADFFELDSAEESKAPEVHF